MKKKTQSPMFLYFSKKLLSPSPHLVSQKSINKMTGGFMRKEPTNSTRLHAHPQVVDIFTRANSMNLFEKFRGFDEKIAQEFALSLVPHTRTHAIVTFRGLSMEITPKFISRVTTLTLGLPWSKDEKPIG